jgi:hypothetical protein
VPAFETPRGLAPILVDERKRECHAPAGHVVEDQPEDRREHEGHDDRDEQDRAVAQPLPHVLARVPAPFGPSSPSVSPGAMSRLISRTAPSSPKRLRSPLHSRTGGRRGAGRTRALHDAWLGELHGPDRTNTPGPGASAV